jgi:hypothetical protein
LPPAGAAAVPAHELPRPFGVETTRPAGSASMKATPVNANGLGLTFWTVKVRLVLPSTGMTVTPNAWPRTGGACAKPVWTPAPRMTVASARIEMQRRAVPSSAKMTAATAEANAIALSIRHRFASTAVAPGVDSVMSAE